MKETQNAEPQRLVRKDSSTGSTYKLPLEVEFLNRSIFLDLFLYPMSFIIFMVFFFYGRTMLLYVQLSL
ncbi:palindromic element RPE1 domain-containing protein [Candidatus Rickettsia tasmanensis]